MSELDTRRLWEILQAEGFAVEQNAADGTWTYRTPVGYSGRGHATPEEAIAEALRFTISVAKKAMGEKG